MFEQAKIMFIHERATERVTLAEIPLVSKAEFEQEIFGWYILDIDNCLDAVQIHLAEAIGQDR